MSTRIRVSLPDEVAAWLDQEVAEGRAASRAAAVASAVRAAHRRALARADASVYAKAAGDPDLDELAGWAVRHHPAVG